MSWNDESATFYVKDIDKVFTAYFSNVGENLVSKLTNPSNKYDVLAVAQYCSHLALTKNWYTTNRKRLCILRDINTSKTAGVNKLPGRFLEDGVDVLAKSVTDICSFQYLWINSQELSNWQKLNLFSKKAEKLMSEITDLSH